MDPNPKFVHLPDPRFIQPNEPADKHPASIHGGMHPSIPGIDTKSRQPLDPGDELPGGVQLVPVWELEYDRGGED